MKSNYFLITAMVTLIACTSEEKSPTETDTAADFTIAPSADKILEEIENPVIRPVFTSNEVIVKQNEPVEKIDPEKFQSEMVELAAKPETFTISAHRDTVIHASKGTKIKIEAGSFVTADWGRPIEGEVKLVIREYYDLADMVMAGLSTTSGKHLLETGGMIHISAVANDVECKLKDKKSIEIGFPIEKTDSSSSPVAKENMQLFTGNVDRRGRIDWQLSKGKVKTDLLLYSKPEFPGGDMGLVAYMENAIQHPDLPKLRAQLSRVFVSFIISETGEVVEVSVLNGLSPEIDNEVMKMLCNMPAWIPANDNGAQVSARIEMPVYFGLDPARKGTPYRIFDCNYVSPSFASEYKQVETEYYYLESIGLGWLNCDRFIESGGRQIAVTSNNGRVMHIQLVFHEMQAVVSGNYRAGKTYFGNLPAGQKVTLFAFGVFNDTPCLVIKETTTDVAFHHVTFKNPVTHDIIAEEMARIESKLSAWNGS